MPNRILRDWTDSDRVDALTVDAERFFVRLIMKVDDFGRYFAEPKRLRAFLFPLKDSLRETDISRWLAECEKAGLIRCYDATGKRFLEIAEFRQRLRQMRETHPRPSSDGQVADGRPLESEGKQNQNPKGASVSQAAPEKGEISPSGVLQALIMGLNGAYGRGDGFLWGREELEAVGILAQRQNVLGELSAVLAYLRRLKGPEKRFYPKLANLLGDWNSTLDRATLTAPALIKSSPPPQPKGKELTADEMREFGKEWQKLKKTL